MLTNTYGSRERLADILGIGPRDFCHKWNELANLGALDGPPKRRVPMPNDLADAKVSDLPLLTYSERDGGPYFTSALFLAEEPETGVPNLSFHRSMFVSDDELRCRLAPTHHLTMYHEKAGADGPPPGGGDADRGRSRRSSSPPPRRCPMKPTSWRSPPTSPAPRLKMRPCKHIDLMVPASTEVVIEGRFLPNERRPEGPFGEFMGYYVPVGDNAVFEVLGVSVREDAVFHSINCGSAEEVLTLELSIAANTYSRISAVLPGILDVACLPFVLQTVVQIRQHFDGHARQVILSVFGNSPIWAQVLHRRRRRCRPLRFERRQLGGDDPGAPGP